MNTISNQMGDLRSSVFSTSLLFLLFTCSLQLTASVPRSLSVMMAAPWFQLMEALSWGSSVQVTRKIVTWEFDTKTFQSKLLFGLRIDATRLMTRSVC